MAAHAEQVPPSVSGAPLAAVPNESTVLREIRRSETALSARLHSIERDTCLVLELYEHLHCSLPLFGNARAGCWYVPPSASTKTCSFKSADGHYGNWSLSLRRPNLHVLRHALDAGGAVIVDATRSGKRIPDALSKTVPIWCAAMTLLTNSAPCCGVAAACESCVDDALHLPPFITSSERARIVALLPQWLQTWRESNVELPTHLSLPIRPLWVTPGRAVWMDGLPKATELGFIPIVCISASAPNDAVRKELPGRAEETLHCQVKFPTRHHSYAYVQGAGDDEENWAHGLTPQQFWCSRERIFASIPLGNLAVIDTIKSVVGEGFGTPHESISNAGLLGQRIEIRHMPESCVPQQPPPGFDAVVVLGVTKPLSHDDKLLYCPLRDRKGRIDHKHALCRELGAILSCMRDARHYVLLLGVGDHGRDAATAVAVAWVAWHCDTEMNIVDTPRQRTTVSKKCVHAAMLCVLAARPDLHITRNALQQVNRFFQSPCPPSTLSDVHP